MEKNIKKEDIKIFKKILEKTKYTPTQMNKGIIFFPISEEKVVNDGSFEFVVKGNSSGSRKFVRAGLTVMVDGNDKTLVSLGYADISFAPYFDIVQFAELSGKKFSKQDAIDISSVDCYLIQEAQLLGHYFL